MLFDYKRRIEEDARDQITKYLIHYSLKKCHEDNV